MAGLYDMVLVAALAFVIGCDPVPALLGIRLSAGSESDVLTSIFESVVVNPINESGADCIACPSKNATGTRASSER